MTKYHHIALIPARGGSKGIAKKNIVQLCGKPLIYYSIRASLGEPRIRKTFVSSDCPEILKVAAETGATPLERPRSLSLDTTPMLPVMQHAVEHYLDSIDDVNIDGVLILLQPTSPLRSASDITGACDIFDQKQAEALISVTEEDNKCLKNFMLDRSGFLRGIAGNDYPFMQRQELPSVYKPNGAIYIYRFRDVLNGTMFPMNTIPFVMPAATSIDIDSLADLEEAEKHSQILKRV